MLRKGARGAEGEFDLEKKVERIMKKEEYRSGMKMRKRKSGVKREVWRKIQVCREKENEGGQGNFVGGEIQEGSVA